MTLLFITLFVAMLIGVPVAFAVGLAVLVYLVSAGTFPIEILMQRSIAGVNSFPLLALPLFILAGYLMELGVTERLVRLADSLVGWMRGGLAAVSVTASGMFGAVSGSGVATIAAVGSILMPAMTKRGYKPGFVIALQGTAGGLGFLIPPSITMVVFAIAGNVSVGAALIAGLIPGIVLTIVLSATAIIASRRYGFKSEDANGFDVKEVGRRLVSAIPPLGLPIIVVGGILAGVFTPTEAAGIAVLFAFVLVFLYRNVTIKNLRSVLTKSIRTSVIILPIIAFSSAFAWIITIENVPVAVIDFMKNVSGGSGTMIVLLIMAALLVLGTFMETFAIILITTPVFLPVAEAAGLDPLVYAVLLTLMLMVGGVTPPLAVGLFTAASIVGERAETSFRYLGWFIPPVLATAVLLYLVPEITTFLPDRL